VTFVDISAVHATFCMKFNTAIIKENTHYTTKCCWNMSKKDKIMLFEPRHPPFLSIRASCRNCCKETVPGSLRRMSAPSKHSDLNTLDFISSPTNRLFSEPLKDYWWRQYLEHWEIGGRGCLVWNNVTLSFSDIFQQHLVV